jgi:hypothetical protein
MATIDWPAGIRPATFALQQRRSGLQFRSPFNGTAQAVDFVAERWVFSLLLTPRHYAEAGQVEALLFGLMGGVERVRLWHFTRPIPKGTMRGTPVLASGVSRGGTSLPLTTTTGATLKAGDMIGAGSQLFMVGADCTANGSGAITVPVVNRVRATIAGGAAVTWDAPKAEFIVPTMQAGVNFQPAFLLGVPFDAEEVW